MSSASAILTNLNEPFPSPTSRRPRLLIAAARHGMDDYRSNRDLPRLLGPAHRCEEVVMRLEAMEGSLEQARLAGDPAWSCLRHVEVMIALMSERALRKDPKKGDAPRPLSFDRFDQALR